MLTDEDFLDLEEETCRLEGVANLLSAWSNECGGFETGFLSAVLNEITENIVKIVKKSRILTRFSPWLPFLAPFFNGF